MKKFLAVLLVLCLSLSVLTLVSCEKEKTTAEKVSEAIEAVQAYDAYAATYDMNMKMDMMGMSLDVPMTMDLKIRDAHSESPVASIDMTMEMFGVELEMPMYMEGDWVYSSVMGMNYKTRVEDSEESAYANAVEDMVKDLPEELFEGLEMTLNEDGSETVELSIPQDQFNELFEATLDSVSDTAGEGYSDVSVSDTKVSITIKDGLVSVYDISYKMSMKTEGLSEGELIDVEADAHVILTFTAFGDEVVITPPEGYLDYEEMSADAIG